jgi:hypothetical protein
MVTVRLRCAAEIKPNTLPKPKRPWQKISHHRELNLRAQCSGCCDRRRNSGTGRQRPIVISVVDMGLVRPPIAFYAFDLLRLNGEDLRGLPIEERKAKLSALLKNPPPVSGIQPRLPKTLTSS